MKGFSSRFILMSLLALWPQALWGWTEAHNVASKMAAEMAPAPFADHPQWCAFGVYPDRMNDWDIAQSDHARWAVKILVVEAAGALRDGDQAGACFLATVATHFPQDALSMSHSPLLKMKPQEADVSLLPESLRPMAGALPVQRQTRSIPRYGKGPVDEIKQMGFFAGVAPPALMLPMYQATGGFVHDWLEGTASALAVPVKTREGMMGGASLAGQEPWTLQLVLGDKPYRQTRSPLAWYPEIDETGWSFYHRWIVAQYQGQWLLPMALFNQRSLREGKPRFLEPAELKQVFEEEFRIALQATAALYRYVTVAAAAVVDANWGTLSDTDARLDAMSKEGVVIVLDEDRPQWARAAKFLGAEITFARMRQGITADRPLRIMSRAEAAEVLAGQRDGDCHVIVLQTARDGRHALSVKPRSGDRSRLEIRLVAGEPLAMGNLVDLLLDETHAPLWSCSPPQQAMAALRELWAGAKLANDVRKNRRGGDELMAFVQPKGRPVPYRNVDLDKRKFAGRTEGMKVEPGLYRWLDWALGQMQGN